MVLCDYLGQDSTVEVSVLTYAVIKNTWVAYAILVNLVFSSSKWE